MGGKETPVKSFPPEENNDVHSSKQPNSKSTKTETKKAHTEKQKQKQKSHSRGSVHLAAFTVLSNHPSADFQKNNTLAHQNIHFPFDF